MPSEGCDKIGPMDPREIAVVKPYRVKIKIPKGPEPAIGCGYESVHVRRYLSSPTDVACETLPGYFMWSIDQTTPIQRIERRQGSATDLVLDFNLPGRPPATLTYSAKVGIASRAGKIHD